MGFISEFVSMTQKLGENFDKKVERGEAKFEDLTIARQKYINKQGEYECVCKVTELKNGNAVIACETDAGEQGRVMHFLTRNNEPDALGWYGIFNMMGIAGGLRPSREFIFNELTIQRASEALEKVMNQPFRAKVSFFWKKGAFHPKYVGPGVYTVVDANDEVLKVEGYPLEAGSAQECQALITEQGIPLDRFISSKLVCNVIPVSDQDAQDVKPKQAQVVAKPAKPFAPSTQAFAAPTFAKPVVAPEAEVVTPHGDDVPF